MRGMYYIKSRILARRFPETKNRSVRPVLLGLYLSRTIRVCNRRRKFRSYVTPNRNYGGPISGNVSKSW